VLGVALFEVAGRTADMDASIARARVIGWAWREAARSVPGVLRGQRGGGCLGRGARPGARRRLHGSIGAMCRVRAHLDRRDGDGLLEEWCSPEGIADAAGPLRRGTPGCRSRFTWTGSCWHPRPSAAAKCGVAG